MLHCSMRLSTIFSVFVISNSFSHITSKHLQKTEDIYTDQIIYEKYDALDKGLKNLVSKGIKSALPYVMEASEHLNLSTSCASNLFTLMSDIKKLQLPAMKFLDAAGKLPSGFFSGTFNMIGDYDECLSTKVLHANGNVMLQGQYCMLNLRAILPTKKRKLTLNSGLEELLEHAENTSETMRFYLKHIKYTYSESVKYGLCAPSGCTVKDINMIVKYLGEMFFLNATVQYCDQQNELEMHPGMVVAIFFVSLAGLLAIVGSSMDFYSRKKEIFFKKSIARYLMCFSVLANFPKIINTKTQDTVLTSIFGIRTLSLFYIILLHQYFFWSAFQLNGHAYLFTDEIPSFFSQVLYNGFLTTDVFFFLGGLLNAYSRMKIQADGKRQISTMQIIIHRLWRIYPAYIFSMLLLYLFANTYGPMATFMRQEFIKPCEQRWWENLLFINNFFSQEKTCMVHSWYIAADMQLFLISLFTVPVFFKNAKRGIIFHVCVLIAGLAGTILWAWHKELLPSTIVYIVEKDDLQRTWNAYVTILPHIAPYFTGLIVGYVLSEWNQFKISRIYRLLGWLTAATFFLSMLFIIKIWNSGVEFTLIESVLYFTFSRLLYVIAVAWLVICCARGYGGIINYILSLKIWIPLARISYMVYMISPLLQIHYYANLKMRIDVDKMTMIWRHIGDLGVSCLLALAMVVTMESPFIRMEKLMFHKKSGIQDCPNNNIKNPGKCINNDKIEKESEL